MASGLTAAESERLLRRSVALVREARDSFWAAYSAEASTPVVQHLPSSARLRPLVAASVGSYGAFLADGSEYRGDYGLSVGELKRFHRPRLAVLADSGADLIAFETVPSLAEGVALAELAEEFPDLRAWLAFSCRDETRVCHGEPLADCVRAVEGSTQIVAVGVNCTAPIHLDGLLEAAKDATDKPLVVYPNAGREWSDAAHCWLPGPSQVDDWAAAARRWRAAGARLIGGCCQTGLAEVRAIRAGLIGKAE